MLTIKPKNLIQITYQDNNSTISLGESNNSNWDSLTINCRRAE